MSKVEKWQKRLKLRRISTYAIIGLSILTIVIILITIYGQHVGNFVIRAPDDKNGLALSETYDFANPKARLSAPGLDEQDNTTLSWIPVDELIAKDGSNNDPRRRFIAYSFYLKNAGRDTVNYEYDIQITEVSKGVDSAVRVMVVHEGREVFAKPQEAPSPSVGQPENFPYDTTPFNGKEVCRKRETLFASGAIRKFTIIIWLEGEDAQCVDRILGGTIKMEMSIALAP